NGCPQLVAKRIIDNAKTSPVASRDLTLGFELRASGLDALLKRDGNTGVGNAVGEIDGAVNRVHDPAVARPRIAGDAPFTEKVNVGKGRAQGSLDQFLGPNVQFEFDVILRGGSGAFAPV